MKTFASVSFTLLFVFLFTPFSSVSAKSENSRFVEQCLDSGDSLSSCISRETEIRKNIGKLRREKRMQFVQMIIEAKRYCRGEYADPQNIRLCFRVHVRDRVKDFLFAFRDAKKKCREEGKIGEEIAYCGLQLLLGENKEGSEEEGNNEENNEGEGQNEEENNNNEGNNEEEGGGEEENQNEEEFSEATLRLEYLYDAEGNITFTWTTQEIASCIASSNPMHTDWNGEKSATGGTEIIPNVTEVTTFTLRCTPNIEGVDDIVVTKEIDTRQ